MDFTKKFDLERVGITKNAQRQPDKPALIMNEVAVTFRQLDKQTNALANALVEMGIMPGDRISLLFYNSPEIMKIWTAAGKISVTPIALNYRFKADELAFIINDSQSRLLIYSDEFDGVVSAARPKFMEPSVRLIRCGKQPPSGVLSLDELIECAPNTPPQAGQSENHGVASSLIYTSGTTGRPKGVVRGIKNRLNSLLGYAYTFESSYDDTHLVAGPLYHSAPYAWAAFSMILRNTVVIMPGFDAENFLRLTDQHKATTVWVVPTMINRILSLPDKIKNQYDASSLRVITVGGESFPFALKKAAVEFFGEGRIFEFFGATEISCVTYMRPEDQLRKPGSCGKPTMGNDIRLLDENMNEVPQGEVGVMYVKSPFLLDGYYQNPEATEANYHNGYFTVWDMARVDKDGYYYIVDRAVDMIISGGVNIYPAEIEEVLYTHPGIFDAGIIGVPDSEWGERIVAVVVPQPGANLTGDDVINFVGEKLASFKKPKKVYFVDELPYSPSGKMLKRVLRAKYRSGN